MVQRGKCPLYLVKTEAGFIVKGVHNNKQTPRNTQRTSSTRTVIEASYCRLFVFVSGGKFCYSDESKPQRLYQSIRNRPGEIQCTSCKQLVEKETGPNIPFAFPIPFVPSLCTIEITLTGTSIKACAKAFWLFGV